MKKILLHFKYNVSQSIKSVNNEQGFILAAVLLLSVMLVLAVTMALWSADTELKIVRNESLMTQDFYNTETGISSSLLDQDWLDSDFMGNNLMGDLSVSKILAISNYGQVVEIDDLKATPRFTVPEGQSAPAVRVTTVGIRHLGLYSDSPTGGDRLPNIPDFNELYSNDSAGEYQQPNVAYAGPAPGFGQNYIARRYAVTARDESFLEENRDASTGNAIIQVGIWRVTNRPQD